jgi:hypothetical protein
VISFISFFSIIILQTSCCSWPINSKFLEYDDDDDDMEIAASLQSNFCRNKFTVNSMSQDYNHQGIFTFSNDYDRSQPSQQNHIAQQIRRDKLRVQGFEQPLVPLDDHDPESANLQPYETAGMLSEMFNFPTGAGTATELLENHMHMPRGDWYGNRQLGEPKNHHHSQIPGMNTGNSAAAMQLFLMNPPQPRSPNSPSSSSHHNHNHNTLRMLLPTQTNPSSSGGHFGQFAWPPNAAEMGGVVAEGQGLSLSLSSSLQHLEAAKAEELRMGDSGIMYYNQPAGVVNNTASSYDQFKNYGGVGQSQHQQIHVGYGSNSLGVVNVLRNSRYVKAAQELLEEFCSVGRGHLKKNKFTRGSTNPNTSQTSSGGGGGNSSPSSKDPPPPLSAADRIEHQRRKVKLLSMLDEVDRRYNHYCEQMQMVVNSFDLVMGFGSAVPYTALAQKAMSRHFRCLKDAISSQLKHSCELLGEKDAGTSGVTKGETPRLKLLEQSLRQQRAFHQMGMMEQEAWRPQRGLPERSVNILRAWLFEHFLHPYPSDADKHLLARQTGLSRNQVSNWFINARVRLWKPMVEEMYQKESKEETTEEEENSTTVATDPDPDPNPNKPSTTTASSATTTSTANIMNRSHINYAENDPSLLAINTHCFQNQPKHGSHHPAPFSMPPMSQPFVPAGGDVVGPPMIRFGNAAAGDVSLTLGLRHAGNLPENGNFSVRDFGGC